MVNESAKAYLAFKIYRDLGQERSIDKACAIHNGGSVGGGKGARYGRWSTWSMDHDWVERARLYDEHVDQEEQETRATFCGEIRRLRVEFSLKCYEMLCQKLGMIDVGKLTVNECLKLAQIALEMEAISSAPVEEIPPGMSRTDYLATLPEVKYAQEILADPVARGLLCDLVERTHTGKNVPGRAGDVHDKRELEARSSPCPAQ
ncbi:MAG: hypothetical protein WCK39_00665 [Methanomassiliicoccales archaeon]